MQKNETDKFLKSLYFVYCNDSLYDTVFHVCSKYKHTKLKVK